ncbi:MAG TPA: hypothetical protein VJS30_05845 [Paraburkholderia sp.]|nr:hypothetical protein [Paraburkholderia sp.]
MRIAVKDDDVALVVPAHEQKVCRHPTVAPFAQHSTLGGSYLLRGFGEGIKTYVD